MEENASWSCSVVYLCASAQDDIHELYPKNATPVSADKALDGDTYLRQVYENVEVLLDENQGGYDEVFLCSRASRCMDRLEEYANSRPTVVLVELHSTCNPDHVSPDALKGKNRDTLPYLRALSLDIQGARFQRPVVPFALLTSEGSPEAETVLDSTIADDSLSAGATAILHSPLRHTDIHRLVGHVKVATRPPARLVGAPMARNLVDSIRNTSTPEVACHRPDETLSEERKNAVENTITQWNFPAQDLDMDELSYGALFMLEHILSHPDLKAYAIPRPQLMTFLLETRRQYKHEREVHYHNWRHAVDVTQSLYCFLRFVRLVSVEADAPQLPHLHGLERVLSPLDGLILIVSAIGHDVGHPGVNNAFLVACNHPLAQTYNDKSVLENYHCAAYSQLLRRHWPSLSTVAGFRSSMISTILSTDMQRHFEYMSSLDDLKRKRETSDVDLDDWSDKEKTSARELVMALLMKAADISNVARPFNVSSRWATILMNEFSRQGELESELAMSTCLFGGPPNKEDMLAAAQSQKGFMSLFGSPLFRGIAEIMPGVTCAIDELENNQDIWDRKIHEERERRDSDGASAPLTFQSVTKDEVEEADHGTHGRKSEPTVVPTKVAQPPSSSQSRVATSFWGSSTTERHGARELKQEYAQGVSAKDGRRSSAPFAGVAGVTLPPSSRRSSKDVALDQWKQLNAYSPPSSRSPNSRRGSAEANAGWQIHQSYPSSRRGSKDESLTTILVTGGTSSAPSTGNNSNSNPSHSNSPARRVSPGSHAKKPSAIKHTHPHPATIHHSPSHSQTHTHSQKPSTSHPRTSIPSSRSHATSSATATTTHNSPSTQPSSLAPDDTAPPPDDHEPETNSPSLSPETDTDATPSPLPAKPAHHHPSIASTEDPFIVPGTWPTDLDGAQPARRHPPSSQHAPPTPSSVETKSSRPGSVGVNGALSGSGNGSAGLAPPVAAEGGERRRRRRRSWRGGGGGGNGDAAKGTVTGTAARESRSRSRLRGLKFWRRRRGDEDAASA